MAGICRHAAELGCGAVTRECSNTNHVALDFYDTIETDRIDRAVYLSLDGEKIAALAGEAR